MYVDVKGFRFKNMWLYLHTQPCGSNKLPGVKGFCIALESRSFDPEFHAELCKTLATAYEAKGSPTALQEGYLHVYTQGRLNNMEWCMLLPFFDSAAMLERFV